MLLFRGLLLNIIWPLEGSKYFVKFVKRYYLVTVG